MTPHHDDSGSLRPWSASSEWASGLKTGLLLGLAALVLCVPPRGMVSPSAARVGHSMTVASAGMASINTKAPAMAATPAAPLPEVADFGTAAPSPDARQVADWVARSGDNQRGPFVVLDKVNARVFVFDAQAKLTGTALVLLGSMPGDDDAPGIGSKTLAQIQSFERTTPAGRFLSVPGRDETGDDVVWVNYDSSLAMHRVKVVDPKEKRFERIATTATDDKRISNGCINVPVAFYDRFIAPTLGRAKAHVYILPEEKTLAEVFPDAVADPFEVQSAAP